MHTTDDDEKIINSALDMLVEHFDTVQIFCSRHEANKENGTVGFQAGRGNMYAREGQIKSWLTKHKERLKEEVRNEEE